MKHDFNELSRRGLLRFFAALPFAALLSITAKGSMLEPTPEAPDDEPTPSQTAGPYFKISSPERTSILEKDTNGTKLVVQGRVIDVHGKPVSKALLDFWQCDGAGVYDNEGFRLRGHQYADADGRFRLETVVPGLYPGRTRHIHVRVQRPHAGILTTQLYFPEEPRNRNDGIFDKRLLLKMSEKEGVKSGAFDFVLG